MKGVYKRPDSPFYWIGYADANGKIQRESSASTRKSDAQALLLRRKQAALDGKNLSQKRISKATLREFMPDYLAWQSGRQKSFSRTQRISSQLVADLGGIPLNAFTAKIIERWMGMRQTDRGNKPASVNRMLAVLKHVFTKAYEYGMISDPTRDEIKKIHLIPCQNSRLRYLSANESATLIVNCAPHIRPIVITALYTGMRLGEILSLTWAHVDLKNCLITLDKTKSGNRREIPICNTLAETLSKIPIMKDISYVFHDKDGQRYHEIKRSFLTACEKSKITDFTFHDLRHTFASNLVMAGVDIRTVQELLGHKTLAMTVRYAHLADSHRKQAVEMFERRMNS